MQKIIQNIYKRITLLEIELEATQEVIKETNPELFDKIQLKKKSAEFQEKISEKVNSF